MVVVAALLLVVAACGDDDDSATTAAPATTAAATTTEAPTTTAAPTTTVAPAPEGDPVQGGLLYDKWWVVAGVDEPADDNPIWARQSTNERSGSTTWRCKECHGWDYQGAAGAYGSGSHFTGFPGVFGTSLSPAEVIAQLSGQVDPEHDFSVMGEQSMADLAALITSALEDYGQFLDTDNAIVGGDVANGETLYASTCAACHGADGTQINFGDEDEPEYLGTIAVGNPWEFLHKVWYGQPGTQMPSAILIGWSETDVLDVATFSQTLPTE
jgi:thiosulfate dehydrogenase